MEILCTRLFRWSCLAGLIGLTACAPRADLVVSKPSREQPVPSSEWREVVSRHGHFTVLMPGKPTAVTNVVPTPLGELVAYSVTAEPAETMAYAVWVYDIPPRAQSSNWPHLLDNIRTNLLAGGRLISERPVATDARDGKEFVLEKYSGRARITARIFRVDDRVCAAFVLMPNQLFTPPMHPDTQRKASILLNSFFDSLKFR